MPASKTLHFNPVNTKMKTRCGRLLGDVLWRLDIKDATYNRCLQLMEKFG